MYINLIVQSMTNLVTVFIARNLNWSVDVHIYFFFHKVTLLIDTVIGVVSLTLQST